VNVNQIFECLNWFNIFFHRSNWKTRC